MIDAGGQGGPGGALGPDARALLEAARGGLGPDAAAMRRMRAQIELSAGGAAGVAIGVKLALLAAVVVGVGVGAGVVATRRSTVAVAPRVELASPPEGAVQVAVRERAVQPPSDDELIVIEPMAPPPRRAKAAEAPSAAPVQRVGDRSATERRGVERGGSERGGSERGGGERGAAERGGTERSAALRSSDGAATASLSREVELLDLAMVALRRRDPGAAIRAVQQHAAETVGRGQLAEDAAAIEIEALCHLHDPSTTAKLEAFDARYPRSAQRSRLSTRCP